MEADWAVEVGPEMPTIVVPWEGFVDLRQNTWTASEDIPESAGHSSLRQALIVLNSGESPVFTSKCDVWPLDGNELDPDEFGARSEHAQSGFASYIDVVACDSALLSSFEYHEFLVRRITEELRSLGILNGRVDLVIRPAMIDPLQGFGVTIYAAGCGTEKATAYRAWEAVLEAAVNATMRVVRSSHSGASSSIG